MALPAFFFTSKHITPEFMKKEAWKPIKGYEGYYEVSDLGRIRSLNYNHTREVAIMTPWASPKGYQCIHLCKNGVTRSYRVSRLVAEAFIPNPENKLYVDHIDTNRRNNQVENLRWCTQSENQRNEISRKRYGESKSKPVVQMTISGEIIKVWPSAFEAERNGFNRDLIRAAIVGRIKTHFGYKWKYYAKEEEI